ncbi:tyrosine-type recombinase/integrase [Streptomyces chilikensis]|uniref:Site-specific integrase n=1 Tax=Streptomyces chilikensis TaxID=1194079 RepID=A0ABV3EJ57_9ACTN
MGRKPAKRRDDGAGTIIFREEDQSWHGWVTVGTKPDGKRDRRHRRAKTKTELLAKMDELKKQRDSGQVRGPGKGPTLGEWLMDYLDTVCARKVADGTMSPRTLEDYVSKARIHVLPTVGSQPLDALRPDHLERTYIDLLSGKHTGRVLASRTVLKVHWLISGALKAAHRRGMVARNVADLVEAPAPADEEIVPFTREEARQVLAAATKRRNGLRWAVSLALGLRQGEALGLRWEYVNLDKAEIKVWWQLQRLAWQHGCDDPHACGEARHKQVPCPKGCGKHSKVRGCPPVCAPDCEKHAAKCPLRKEGGLVFRPPKTKGRRVVPIPPPMIPMFRAHAVQQKRERLVAGQRWQPHDLVFCYEDGHPIGPRADWAEWKEILVEAGVRDARVHDGRHTAGTLMIEEGVNERVVMELLGHSSIVLTQRYTHVASSLAATAAVKMGDALFG